MKKIKASYHFFLQVRLLLIFILISSQFHFNQSLKAQTAKEYALKSAFVLHVANFVDWPQNSKVNDKTKDFVIGIYGDNPFDNTLKEAINAKKKEIKGKKITVKVITQLDEIGTADILFISSSEKYNLSKVLKRTENYSILTIGDTKGYAERGVMINIFISGSYLAFNVNTPAYKQANLYISSKLLSRASKVIN